MKWTVYRIPESDVLRIAGGWSAQIRQRRCSSAMCSLRPIGKRARTAPETKGIKGIAKTLFDDQDGVMFAAGSRNVKGWMRTAGTWNGSRTVSG
jgi:hypothetical protein